MLKYPFFAKIFRNPYASKTRNPSNPRKIELHGPSHLGGYYDHPQNEKKLSDQCRTPARTCSYHRSDCGCTDYKLHATHLQNLIASAMLNPLRHRCSFRRIRKLALLVFMGFWGLWCLVSAFLPLIGSDIGFGTKGVLPDEQTP